MRPNLARCRCLCAQSEPERPQTTRPPGPIGESGCRWSYADHTPQAEDDEDASRALVTRLKELEIEEARLEGRLIVLPRRVVLRRPADYEAVDRAAIAQLEQHLAAPDAAPSWGTIRALIEAVVVHAGDIGGRKARRLELHGDLFRMPRVRASRC